MNPFALLFDYRGRINRAKFWLAVAIWIVFFLLAIGIGSTTGSRDAVFIAAPLAFIPILVSIIAVGIKRLHDRDKSPWWLAVFLVVPQVLPFVGVLLADDAAADALPIGALVLLYISFGVTLWGLVELGAIRGTVGVNRHGPDPLAPAPAPARAAH
jgi:uncharacterized membrane protein YhaH (DUF805 family)